MISLVMPIYCPPGGEETVYKTLDAVESNTNGVCQFDRQIAVVNGVGRLSFVQFRGGSWTLKVIKNPIGFTKAFNIGLSMADGNDIVLLNHDAIVPPGWLDRLVTDADKTGGVMCCSDQHLRLRSGIHDNRGWGACFYLPRRVLDAVGPWDETFNYRYSDQDYWIRCKKAGFSVSTTGNVVLNHVNSHAFRHQLREDGISQAVEEERREMIRRHGAAELSQWLKLQSKISKRC